MPIKIVDSAAHVAQVYNLLDSKTAHRLPTIAWISHNTDLSTCAWKTHKTEFPTLSTISTTTTILDILFNLKNKKVKITDKIENIIITFYKIV